jgi:hypothetical protein
MNNFFKKQSSLKLLQNNFFSQYMHSNKKYQGTVRAFSMLPVTILVRILRHQDFVQSHRLKYNHFGWNKGKPTQTFVKYGPKQEHKHSKNVPESYAKKTE